MLNGFVAACVMSAMGLWAPATSPSARTIVRLVGQRGTITVTSTTNGPRYSASDSRGTSICSNLTLDELRRNHPAVYRLVDPTLCGEPYSAHQLPAPLLMAGSD